MRSHFPRALATILLALAAVPLLLASDHGHAHGHHHETKAAGPNGGRLITSIDPHAEFFVTGERKVQITFVGDDGAVIPPSGQIIEVTTGQRSAPVTLTFEKTATAWLSEQPLPEGERLPAVVQIRMNPESETITERFTLDLSHCSGCGLAEYACTCTDH